MELLLEVLNRIGRPDIVSMRAMQHRMDRLTKPLGSLGRLEEIAVRLAGIQGSSTPKLAHKAVVIMCGDHGVTEEGVSAYPADVTGLMMGNFARGGAAINVLARQMGAQIRVVDVGSRLEEAPEGVAARKVRAGTANMTAGPAMSRSEAVAAMHVGIETALSLADEGTDAIALGEMGIGNTTPSSAMTALLLDKPVRELTGKGTGIDEERLNGKVQAIERAIRVNRPDPNDPLDVLAKVGGLEIAGLVGVIFGAASRRVAVVVDGVITAAAALAACRIEPRCRDYLLASHVSVEPAHAYILQELGLRPALQLDMRLGEGTGAALVFPVLEAAVRLVDQMATFADLGLPNPEPDQEPMLLASWPHRSPGTAGGSGATSASAGGAAGRTERVGSGDHAFSEAEKAAVYRAIVERRDIRSFRPEPVPEELLARLLRAAHYAPSVGYMQPWNFIVIRSEQTKRQLQQAADKERRALQVHYEGERADRFAKLKIEALTEAPVTLCVTVDPTRGGPHVLGRNSIPETDLASAACAIQNLWLAARTEGLAVGWVSFYKKQDVRGILGIPPHIDPTALLSIGYTDHFPERPLLESAGWRERLDLGQLLYAERWGKPLRDTDKNGGGDEWKR